MIGVTRRYGYTAARDDVSPAEEAQYINQIHQQFYSALGATPVALSEKTFTEYGASTTPTLVLIGRRGIVRWYHPGALEYDELAKAVSTAMHEPAAPAVKDR